MNNIEKLDIKILQKQWDALREKINTSSENINKNKG